MDDEEGRWTTDKQARAPWWMMVEGNEKKQTQENTYWSSNLVVEHVGESGEERNKVMMPGSIRLILHVIMD